MATDPKPLSRLRRLFHFDVRALLIFVPGVLVGGGFVLYSALALREVLSEHAELGGDLVRFAPPSCPSGTTTTIQLHLTEHGELSISFAVTPDTGQSMCDHLEFAIDIPNDKPVPTPEVNTGGILVKVDERTSVFESLPLPVSAPVESPPCPEKDGWYDDFVSVGERVCRTYVVTSRLAPAANIHIHLVDALFRRTYLKRGEHKDSALLIYGAILGTGLALLAEAVTSFLKRLVAPQKEED